MGAVMDLGGDVKVPVVGKVPRSGAALVAVAAAGAVAYAWWSRTRSAQASTAAEEPSNAPVGSGSGANSGHIEPQPAPDDSGVIRTDQQWMARALDALSWYEPAHVSAVLSRYLDRQPIQASEEQLVREAWAQVGKPPSGQPIIRASAPATPVPDDPHKRVPVPRRPAPRVPRVPVPQRPRHTP